MKFIKTADGWYIDKSKIDSFTVCKYFGVDGKGEGFAACAFVDGAKWRLKEFSCCPDGEAKFDPQAEAQAWLDKFVADLNGESNES